MEKKKFNPAYKIYKPNQKDSAKGTATSWEFNPTTNNFFLTIAKQSESKDDSGNAVFQWKDSSETIKLDLEELSEICLVIDDKKDHVGGHDGQTGKGKGLFHQTKDGNTIVKFYQIEQGGEGMHFGLEISSKKLNVQFWAGQRITPAEAGVIKTMLQSVIQSIIF